MMDDGRLMTEYKFQKLQVYQMALDYADHIYDLADRLPDSENFNLKSQIRRAATSIVLNIAEGSTGQSDGEQHRFLGLSLRSYLETIACLDFIERRKYLSKDEITPFRTSGHELFIKLQAFRKSIRPS
jgi:four helix bundle protein